MACCIQILSKKLMKLRARVETPFLCKCSWWALRQAVSILLLSTIKISSSLASFLKDLFKTSILLLIPWRSFLIVSDDSATAVYGDSFFTSEIISLIVSVVFNGILFCQIIGSAVYQNAIRLSSNYGPNMVFTVQTCCATVGSYLHIMSFSQQW